MEFDKFGFACLSIITLGVMILGSIFFVLVGKDMVHVEAIDKGHAEYILTNSPRPEFTWLDHNEEDK